jgi:hypothetical protein
VSLLQRLAGQARGAAGPRIRSTAAAIAQVPIARPHRAAAERIPSAVVERHPLASVRPATQAAAPGDVRVIERDRSDSGAERTPHHTEALPPIDRRALPPSVVIRSGPDTPAIEPRPLEPIIVSALPAPLLGEVVPRMPTLATTGAIRPAAPVEARRRDAVESTEVHVHIGRIEVTALQAPGDAQPKASTRRARASAPLSDYLAKRRSS